MAHVIKSIKYVGVLADYLVSEFNMIRFTDSYYVWTFFSHDYRYYIRVVLKMFYFYRGVKCEHCLM